MWNYFKTVIMNTYNRMNFKAQAMGKINFLSEFSLNEFS